MADGGVDPDRGRAVVSLGMSFPYYGQTYSQITVTANGSAFLVPDSDPNANYLLNLPILNTTELNGVVAPFWDDLRGNNPGSAVRKQVVTGANGTGVAIEWHDWNREFGTYSLNFQIRLWENGIIEFFYGTMAGSGAQATATIGIESPTGGAGTSPFTCGAICDLSTLNPVNPDGGAAPPGISYIKFGPPPGIDLEASQLRVTALTDDAGVLSLSTELRIRNFGTVASNAFSYRLYLSQDTIVDVGDPELAPSPWPVLSLNPNESRLVTAAATVARPDAGAYYVLAYVDSEHVVNEPVELRANNTAATSVPYSAGVDLVAEGVTAPLTAGPGDVVSVPVSFTNQGFEAAGAVPVKVWASADALLDATDRLLFTTTIDVTGGQAVRQALSFAMPAGIAADNYFLALQLDDDPGVITESSKANNLVFSQTRLTVKQPDLVVDSVVVRRPVAPYPVSDLAFFGEPIRLDAQIRNQGGSVANGVTVQFYLSDNATLNGLSDPSVGKVSGLTINPGESTLVTLSANVPTVSVSNQPLKTQSYFFFAAALAPGLSEPDTSNNLADSVPTWVRPPAANITPVNVRGPASVGAGELVPVSRTLANVGNRAATHVKYRYYLSANQQITTEDTLLPIQTALGLANEQYVDLAVNAQDAANEFVLLPSSLPNSTQYLGVLVDPDNELDETAKDDNGFAGQAVRVVAQDLAVSTPFLPDATVGQPFDVALGARGGDGPYAFAVNPPSVLPGGLALTPDGRLTGTPSVPGVFGFTVTVSSGARSASARLIVRVLDATAPLAVTTQALAAPVRLTAYDVQLGAAGGQAPYRWAVLSGLVPSGLTLNDAGRLSGTPTGTLGSTATFTVGVRDAVGNAAAKVFALTTVDAAPLQFVNSALPDGVIGSEYLTLLAVKNVSNAPVAVPVRWNVASGALPDGLVLEASSADTVAVSGTPTRTGLFACRIEATDAFGRVAALNAAVLVYGPAVTISGSVPDSVSIGTPVSVQLVATPAQPGSQWFVRDGLLPAGITLTTSGLLEGDVVAGGAASYTFTVGVGASRAELRGLRTYRVDVVTVAPKPKTGCSASGAGPEFVGAALAWVVFARRRRRAPARWSESPSPR